MPAPSQINARAKNPDHANHMAFVVFTCSRRAPVAGPGDGVAVGQVAAAAQLDCRHMRAAKAAHGIDKRFIHNNGGDAIGGLPAALPKQFAVAELVTADGAGAVDNNLRDPVMRCDYRGAPAGGFIPVLFPFQLAGLFVERVDCRVALVIPQ